MIWTDESINIRLSGGKYFGTVLEYVDGITLGIDGKQIWAHYMDTLMVLIMTCLRVYSIEVYWDHLMVKCLTLMKELHWDLLIV